MNRGVDVAAEGVRVPLARARVADIVREVLRAEQVGNALLSITFVTARRMAALNRRHLGHAGGTDVISFGFARARAGDPVVGDIYIAPAVGRRNAAAHGVPVREEIVRLVVHGVLHVLGFDHPEGADRTASPMWTRQEQLVRRLIGGARPRLVRRASSRTHAR